MRIRGNEQYGSLARASSVARAPGRLKVWESTSFSSGDVENDAKDGGVRVDVVKKEICRAEEDGAFDENCGEVMTKEMKIAGEGWRG